MATASKTFSSEDDRPIKVFFEDEGRFGRMDRPYYCWAAPGVRPVVYSQIVREYTHAFSAICPHDGDCFSLVLPYADSEAMKIFLKELSKEYSAYRVILVMDKAAWHKSKSLGEFENIRVVFQPAYSPEVNPVEHLWEYLRENYFKNRPWRSMEALEEALCAALNDLLKIKSILQSLAGFHWAIV